MGSVMTLAVRSVVFHPRGMRKRNPDGTVAHQELDVDRIGVPGGNSDNQRLIAAVHRLARPAIHGLEVIIHRVQPKTIADT